MKINTTLIIDLSSYLVDPDGNPLTLISSYFIDPSLKSMNMNSTSTPLSIINDFNFSMNASLFSYVGNFTVYV